MKSKDVLGDASKHFELLPDVLLYNVRRIKENEKYEQSET